MLVFFLFSAMLDSIVTFRKADATIKIDTFEADPAGDIWFQKVVSGLTKPGEMDKILSSMAENK
jgi:hypothetical protein